MRTELSPSILIYRRSSGRFGPLREALARAEFRAVTPPDPLGQWECVDAAGTRVRGAEEMVLVEALGRREGEVFDARFRLAFPSDGAIPDGGPPPEVVEVVAGSDEAGKGERARAVVVAAVAVPVRREQDMIERGVRDSKTCGSREIEALSRWIRGEFVHAVRVVGAEEREAAMRAHGGNETRLLASMHAECIGEVRGRGEVGVVRVDRFAPGRPVAGALAGRWGSGLLVDECVRGERHVACAAASIVARSLA